MLKRTITGVVLAVVVLACICLQGYLMAGVVSVIALLAMHEMLSCLKKAGKQPVAWVSYLFVAVNGVLQALVLHRSGGVYQSLAVTQIVMALCAVIGFGCVVAKGRVDMEKAFSTLIPLLYPGMFVSLIFPLNLIGGKMMTMVALGLCFFVPSMNDMFAMLVGVKCGKRKLSPQLSPKKTVEGSVAGIIAAVVFSVLLPLIFVGVMKLIPSARGLVEPLPALWKLALMGIPCGIAAQFGDLAASLIKRQCGVKDFSNIFPGHGGVIDRVDGVLFAAPVVLCFFMIMGV